MGFLGFLIALAISGAIIGGLGRLALPGPDPMSISQTILVGIGGSLGAGIIVRVISGGRNDAGLIASVLGATAIVYFIRRSRRRDAGGSRPGF
ncbi:MAG: GlsB/YeaQ/YmgE family stress response membrane protein [Acidimicrobiia bacterium]